MLEHVRFQWVLSNVQPISEPISFPRRTLSNGEVVRVRAMQAYVEVVV
jgi:hypothetical protein